MAIGLKRRWFQFRLRTLLVSVVLVGAACGYVAHEASIVQARRNWAAVHLLGQVDSIWVAAKSLDPQRSTSTPFSLGIDDCHTPRIVVRGDPAKLPGFLRRWLGDSGVEAIELLRGSPPADLEQIPTLFPEATIFWGDDDPRPHKSGASMAIR